MLSKMVFGFSVAIALAATSTASAHTKQTGLRSAAPVISPFRAFGAVAPVPWDGIAGTAVVQDGRVIGRDPDANIRLQMYRDLRAPSGAAR
jgi:hypothetical protein